MKPRSSEAKGFVGRGGPRKIDTTKVPARAREQPPLIWSKPRVGSSNGAWLGHQKHGCGKIKGTLEIGYVKMNQITRGVT